MAMDEWKFVLSNAITTLTVKLGVISQSYFILHGSILSE